MMKNNIYRSAAQVTFFSTIEKTLSFFYRIILTRKIGAEGLGIYQICLTVFAVFLTAASSGIPVTVSRLMAKSGAKNDIKGKNAAVTAGIICALAVTVPVALILGLGKNGFGFLFSDARCRDIFIILLPGLVLTSVYAVIRGSFWGNKQFLPYSVIELLENTVMVVTGVILIFGTTDPVAGARNAIIAVVISYVFSFMTSLFWYFKKGGKLINPKRQLKPLVSSAAPITAMRTSTSLLNSAVAVILPALLMSACGLGESEAVSLYGIAAGMAIPMLFIPSSFIGSIAVVVAPELSENYYRGNAAAVKYDVEKSVKASIFIATILMPVLFVLGKPISQLLYSNGLCGEIVQTSAFIMLPMCIVMMTNTVLNSMNCEKLTLVYFVAGAVAMLICIITLTGKLGVYSYVIGLGLSNVITAALNMWLLRRKCREFKCVKYALQSIGVTAFACLFGKLFINLLDDKLADVWQIAICAPVLLAFTAGALYCLNMFTFRPLKRAIAK